MTVTGSGEPGVLSTEDTKMHIVTRLETTRNRLLALTHGCASWRRC